MNKFWQLVSKKDLIFGIVILLAVVLVSIFQPSNKVQAKFGEESVDFKSTKYSMNIPYAIVDYIELVNRPEIGEEVDGHNDMIVQTGSWKNEIWGEYHACVELATDNCIAVHLKDGRIFVISRRDNEETAKVFEEFQTHLNE